MNDEAGRGLRDAFLELLEAMGAEYDVCGTQRVADKNTQMKSGKIVFRFADEFPIKKGERIREAKSELQFEVLETESNTAQGVLVSYDVTAKRA